MTRQLKAGETSAVGDRALRPGHGLVHVPDLPDREAEDQLAGLGERPVDDRQARTFENDALGLDQLLGEPGICRGRDRRF